jgi:hypothetical protein
MSSNGFRNVLAILDGEPERRRAVLERASEIAELEHARLTLAKTREDVRLAACACVFGVATLPPPLELEKHDLDALARTAEQMPQTISLTTLLLGSDAHDSLRALLREGAYDLLVADMRFLRRHRRLRRLLRRDGVSALAVADRPPARRPERAQPPRASLAARA